MKFRIPAGTQGKRYSAECSLGAIFVSTRDVIYDESDVQANKTSIGIITWLGLEPLTAAHADKRTEARASLLADMPGYVIQFSLPADALPWESVVFSYITVMEIP